MGTSTSHNVGTKSEAHITVNICLYIYIYIYIYSNVASLGTLHTRNNGVTPMRMIEQNHPCATSSEHYKHWNFMGVSSRQICAAKG